MTYFTNDEAVAIWKAKWMGEGVQALVLRYERSPFRFYEVWTEQKNNGTRLIAYEEFKKEHPHLALQTNPMPHTPRRQVISRPPPSSPGQLDMFS